MRFRTSGRHLVVVASMLLVLLLAPAGATAAGASFDQWLGDLRRDALGRGISGNTFDAALGGASLVPKALELDRRQPEFTQTFWAYLDRRVTLERIARGRELLARHRDLLATVHRRYGVPPRFIVAFWGLESNYGSYTGDFPLFRTLATLAYDARRSDFFRQQLFAALKLLQRGDLTADAKSSWAGALGQPQFIPTSYRAYAVDFDGDGKRDLRNSLADVFASAANYLAEAGWREAYTWGREVRLPAGFDYSQTGMDIRKSLRDWQRLGVRGAQGQDLPVVDIDGSIILPGGAGGAPAFLVYDNFRTIMAWNRAVLYAAAVGHLADRLAGAGPFAAPRPAVEVALSRQDIMEIQRLLGRLGYGTGGVDGIAGENTRQAIRTFQQRSGLPADGYPSQQLLERLRTVAQR